MDPSRYILPPAPGVSNDLYEAYPANPKSLGTFSQQVQSSDINGDPASFAQRFGGSSGVTGNPASGFPTASPSSNAQPSSDTGSASSISSAIGNAVNGMMGGSSSGSGVQAVIADYFVRGALVILGLIFVAVGLGMFKTFGPVAAVAKVTGVRK